MWGGAQCTSGLGQGQSFGAMVSGWGAGQTCACIGTLGLPQWAWEPMFPRIASLPHRRLGGSAEMPSRPRTAEGKGDLGETRMLGVPSSAFGLQESSDCALDSGYSPSPQHSESPASGSRAGEDKSSCSTCCAEPPSGWPGQFPKMPLRETSACNLHSYHSPKFCPPASAALRPSSGTSQASRGSLNLPGIRQALPPHLPGQSSTPADSGVLARVSMLQIPQEPGSWPVPQCGAWAALDSWLPTGNAGLPSPKKPPLRVNPTKIPRDEPTLRGGPHTPEAAPRLLEARRADRAHKPADCSPVGY